ncbi:hypothetical protein D6827_03455 [Candidatus Parcubacteria bacterium]|nr:MAG: hypothetical protein D6827_03455 [Candidatus Parcubacteria bacterium]
MNIELYARCAHCDQLKPFGVYLNKDEGFICEQCEEWYCADCEMEMFGLGEDVICRYCREGAEQFESEVNYFKGKR